MIWSAKKKLTLIKGHNSVTNLWKMTGNHPNVDFVNINAYTKKFYQLVLKILSGNEILNEILTSVMGHISVTNVQKIMCNNPNLHLVNINADIKFGKILSICSQDIEQT